MSVTLKLRLNKNEMVKREHQGIISDTHRKRGFMGKAGEKAAVCSSIIYGVMAKTHNTVMLNGISLLLLRELKK